MSEIANEIIKDNKNKRNVRCKYCSSLILREQHGEYISTKFDLPLMHQKRAKDATDASETETLTDFWLVHDILTFENLGFSNTVNQYKYLICADCEMGPVGYQDVATKKSYIALKRVQHGNQINKKEPIDLKEL